MTHDFVQIIVKKEQIKQLGQMKGIRSPKKCLQSKVALSFGIC